MFPQLLHFSSSNEMGGGGGGGENFGGRVKVQHALASGFIC